MLCFCWSPEVKEALCDPQRHPPTYSEKVTVEIFIPSETKYYTMFVCINLRSYQLQHYDDGGQAFFVCEYLLNRTIPYELITSLKS